MEGFEGNGRFGVGWEVSLESNSDEEEALAIVSVRKVGGTRGGREVELDDLASVARRI